MYHKYHNFSKIQSKNILKHLDYVYLYYVITGLLRYASPPWFVRKCSPAYFRLPLTCGSTGSFAGSNFTIICLIELKNGPNGPFFNSMGRATRLLRHLGSFAYAHRHTPVYLSPAVRLAFSPVLTCALLNKLKTHLAMVF